MYDVLVIHGAGEPRRRGGEIYWKPLLESALGPGFKVHAPRMPDPEDPHHGAWADCIAEQMSGLDEPFVVGHSLGASTLLKFLSQSAQPPAFKALFLIAVPFWGDDFPEYAMTDDELGQLRQIGPMFFYQSADDDVVPKSHFEKYRRALPQASFHLLQHRGHEFDQPDFPELTQDIRNFRQ